MDRIAAIEKMLQKSPQDVFLHYSLAMEYVSAGRHGDAQREFNQCFELNPQYLPAYIECAKSMRAAGLLDQARSVFSKALELASAKGEKHTQDYIHQQLEGLAKSLS